MKKLATLLLVLIGLTFAEEEWIFRTIDDELNLKKTDWTGPIIDWHDWETNNKAFNFKDFLIFKGDNYYTIKSRLYNNSGRYIEWVKITINLFSGENLVKSDFTYIDFETYGMTGMTPNSFAYFSEMMEIVNFTKVGVRIEYDNKDGSDLKYEPNALKLISSNFTKGFSLYEWNGKVKNASYTALKFPKILAVFYKSGKMMDFDYTYIDTPSDNTMLSNTTQNFDSYVDRPVGYDRIEYVLHYSLQLTGKVNMPNSSVTDAEYFPDNYNLNNIFPNPFNNETTIQIDIPRTSKIRLYVLNIKGEKIDHIYDGFLSAGSHNLKWNASNFSSGTYIIVFENGNIRKTKICSLVK